MSSRPHRLLKTPSKDTTNNEMTIENASVKSANSTGIRGKRKIRRTEDLINLSLVLPKEKKLATVPKSPLQTISPNKNEVKKRQLQLSKFGSELDDVKENLRASYVSPQLKSAKKKKKQIQESLDKNNGITARDTLLQTANLQGKTSIEENVMTNHLPPNKDISPEKMEEDSAVPPREAHQRRGVVKAKRLLKAQTTENAEEKLIVEEKLACKSTDMEKQANCVLPPENGSHQRKVVKAKRLLKSQKEKHEEKTSKMGNSTTNMGQTDTETESKNSFVSELQDALKKRRAKLQRQLPVTEDDVIASEEVKKSPRNEESKSFDKTAKSEEVEKNKKYASEFQEALKKTRSKIQRPPYITEDRVIASEEVKAPRNEESKSFDKTTKSDEEVEENKKYASEFQEALKKRRSKMQCTPYVPEDHVVLSEEVKSPRNEESKSFDKTAKSEEVEKNKKYASEFQEALKKTRSKMQRPPYATEDHVVSEEVKSSRNEEFKSLDKTAKSEEVEENKKYASEFQEALKKRRSKMQRPPYITEDRVSASEEVKAPRNEESKSFDKTTKSDEEVEENKKYASEFQEALKKRRSKMQCTPYVPEDYVVVSEEVKSPRNEKSKSFDKTAKSEEVEEHKKDASVIVIIDDETIIEESDESKNTVTITTLKSPISPSTTSEMPSPIHFKSPIEKILHFDTSNEEIHPSTSGTIEQTTRRRTFELENSVNDITLLKSISKNDSVRMNSFPSSDEDMPAPKLRKSKITFRRKWEIKNDRLSKISPPWLSLDTNEAPESGNNSFTNKEEEEENTPPRTTRKSHCQSLQKNLLTEGVSSGVSFTKEDTDVENTPPKTSRKSQSHSLRKNLLIKGVSENGYVEKTPLKTERKSRSFSVSIEKAAKASTAKKHVSSVKIPNFAAIHQRAFDRMENLSEYKKRKEERAKMLLSGQKPVAFKSPVCKKKKELRFAPDTQEKTQPLDFIPLPSTPIPLKRVRVSRDSVDSPKTPQISNIFNFNPPPPRPICVEKTESAKVQNKILTPKLQFNFKSLKLPEFKFGSGNPQFNFGKTQPISGNNYNRFGFNARQQIAKKEEFKAMVANKSKPTKTTVESRRVVIKGVRSNRRFDLLMEMRKGK